MAKAIWNGTVIAECDSVKHIEGKQYFPHHAVKSNYFVESERHSVCPIKGTANYYHVEVNGKRNSDAAYYYPNPNPRMKSIQNYIGFNDEVEIAE
jgi:uncharacterized protein (DUF427 family)